MIAARRAAALFCSVLFRELLTYRPSAQGEALLAAAKQVAAEERQLRERKQSVSLRWSPRKTRLRIYVYIYKLYIYIKSLPLGSLRFEHVQRRFFVAVRSWGRR